MTVEIWKRICAIQINTNGVLSGEEISSMLFQMIASLAVGQSEMKLRHYDVKLLNFFLKSIDASGGDDVGTADSVDIASYVFGDKNLQLHPVSARI